MMLSITEFIPEKSLDDPATTKVSELGDVLALRKYLRAMHGFLGAVLGGPGWSRSPELFGNVSAPMMFLPVQEGLNLRRHHVT